MRRRLSAIACLLILITAAPAEAQEMGDIAVGAAAYRKTIEALAPRGHNRKAAAAALKTARQQFGKRRWSRAGQQFERAIAFGANGPSVWLELARARLRGSFRSRSNAKFAAYLAHETARTNLTRGRALALMARSMERTNDPRRAIKIYRSALALQKDPAVQKRLAYLERVHAFRFRNYQLDTRDERPRACLRFSRPLRTGRSIDYGDYLSITPDVKIDASVTGDRLCIAGLAYGQAYDVTIRPGVPASDNERTGKSNRITFTIPGRDARVEFRGRAYVLPRVGSQGIPLHSVNVAKAKMQVLRINDRNLINQLVTRRLAGALYAHQIPNIENREGEGVWRGEMDIETKPDKEVTTAFPINEVLKTAEPGIYIVTAQPIKKTRKRYGPIAAQWVVVSDLGIASFQGTDGLRMFVRSLDTGRAVADASLRLYARNNKELARVGTDSEGKATFAPGLLRGRGGNAPAAVMVQGPGGDFNFLDLVAPSLDLSDRGVGGRPAPGPLDAFLYTDRGIYRPGERTHLVAMLRDRVGKAVPAMPLTFRILRPDGTDFRRMAVQPETAGAYRLTLELPSHARTGQWTARVYADPKGAAIGQLAFQVEDFVPERLAVTLDSGDKVVRPGGRAEVRIAGRWLYGAPAAGLRNTGALVIEADPDPFPQHAGYRFGLVQESWTARRSAVAVPKTDKAGQATATVSLPAIADSPQPLKAVFRLSMLEPGGRAVTRSRSFKLRHRAIELGLRARFKGEHVPQGKDAGFDVIAVDADGALKTVTGLNWEIVRERYNYRWYNAGSDWRYRVEIHDEPLASGVFASDASGPVALTRQLTWGRYRLEVYDPASGAASSLRFRSGWFVSADAADSPDKAELTLDQPGYQAGDTARLHIRPPYGGEALITIANERIRETINVSVPAEGTTIEIPVSAAWGGGAYVIATILRPGRTAGRRGPGRAIGVAWLGIDASARKLGIAFDLPAETPSNRRIDIPVTVTGLAPGAEAHVTLAAVDEGILSLTDFKTPDPHGWYFGKRALGVALRDAYGRLIDGRAGARGRVRSGGDALARRRQNSGLAVRSASAVALFSGIVRLDASGKATIPLDLPSFAGRLRLMAVAFSADKIGSAEAPLLVRDPIVAELSLPRFLAPGDTANLSLALRNFAGPVGDYRITVAGSGAVTLGGESSVTRGLARDGAATVALDLTAGAVGVGTLNLKIAGPDGFALQREWRIAVRPAQAVTTRRLIAALAPGGTMRIDNEILTQFHPGTADISASFSTGPNFDVPGLLSSLDRYPYGCLEQTVSRALPLLYLSRVAKAAGVVNEQKATLDIRQRVENAVLRVLDMQRADGSFSLWYSYGPRESWLSSYALDFLRRARALGYDVPDHAYSHGLEWLKASVADGELGGQSPSARTYALYVLAKAGKGNIGAVRQYYDTWFSKLGSAAAQLHLLGALSELGDAERAKAAAQAVIAGTYATERNGYYGSHLRNAAMALALLAETNGTDNETLFRIADWVEARMRDRRYTSTQEKAWLLLAAHAMFERQQPGQVEVDGAARPESRRPVVLSPDETALERGVAVRNMGATALRQVITVAGVPVDDLPAEAEGFRVSRTVYDLKGKEVDLSQAKQGDLYVVLISGRSETKLRHKALVVDLLPGGLEIENTRLRHTGRTSNYAWLPKLTATTHMEFRDDRFIAAMDLNPRNRNFKVAYLVRAVTPGSFKRPAVHVEDMYKPHYFARSEMGRIEVTAP